MIAVSKIFFIVMNITPRLSRWLCLKYFIAGFFAICLGVSNAQTYSQGYQLYRKGKLRPAEKSLSKAAKLTRRSQEKSRIFKLLGIVQFTLGKKQLASSSFRSALRINPRATIRRSEVLDESVLKFFSDIRRTLVRPSGKSKNQGTSRFGKRPNKTTILVKSNVPASISIDGILAGNTGSPIESSPGVAVLTLKSPGYITSRVKMTVRKDRQTVVKVALKKPKPKPKPKPKSKPKPKPKPRKVARGRNTGSDMFSDKEPSYRSSRPARSGGSKKTNRNLVDEFQSGSNSSGSPPPAYGGGYGRSYPQPYMPTPMYYPAPVPYAAPMPYAAPSPYSSPPAYDGGSRLDATPAPPTPDYFRSSRTKSRRKKRKRTIQKSATILTFLPLGAGQYQNGDTLFGVFFTVSQLGSLYLYLDASAEVATFTETEKKVKVDERYNDREEERKGDLDKIRNYIQEKESEANVAIILTASLYVGGVLEAYLNRPKVRVKSNKYGHLLDSGGVRGSVGHIELDTRPSRPLEYRVKTGPLYFSDDDSYGLSLAVEF